MVIADLNAGTDDSLSYYRDGAAAHVVGTAVTGTIGSHVDWGFILLSDTTAIGSYQFGIPDAALVNGAKFVDIMLCFDTDNEADAVHIHIDLIRSVAF